MGQRQLWLMNFPFPQEVTYDYVQSGLALESKFGAPESRRSRCCGSAGAGAFHKLKGGSKQFEILLVVRRVGTIDLNPLSRA